MKQTLQQKTQIQELPYEKLWERGAGALSDQELLAILLQSGDTKHTVLSLAKAVLEICSQYEDGIAGLTRVSNEELLAIPGIGRVKVTRLRAALELGRRACSLVNTDKVICTDPSTIANYCRADLELAKVEHVMVLYFSVKMQLLGRFHVTTGTTNCAMFSIREVLLKALQIGASVLVLVHNHPSGNPQPSHEDDTMTRYVYEACKVMDLQLADHIVIGYGTYFSYLEHGEMPCDL